MSTAKKSSASVGLNGQYRPPSFWPQSPQFNMEKIRKLVAELEVPFKPSLIEWRVTSMNEDRTRGQIMPYADPRAYTDRLNELFTPAGWTRKYAVTTSANFERSRDQKTVAKIFVTCDLTIFGIGSHSATGEEWADDDNAGTSAEAQAFKRACSCFGLGRYLYQFGNIWVDLNDRGWPKDAPQLHGWATPEGWRKGLRPVERDDAEPGKRPARRSIKNQGSNEKRELVRQIEAMFHALGKAMYRGLLKKIARVWNPNDIGDLEVLTTVFRSMQLAEQSLSRLETARDKLVPAVLDSILKSLKLRSLHEIDDLEILEKVVVAAEEKTFQMECG